MAPLITNGIIGAGIAGIRCLSGYLLSKEKTKWDWKRFGGAVLSGFIGGAVGGTVYPDPTIAGTSGWVTSEVAHKVYRKIKDRKRSVEGTKDMLKEE